MSTIDTRIVEMKFMNKDFESGASETLSTLDKLKQALKLDGARKGIDDVSAAAKGFSLSSMSENLEAVKNRFSIMGAIGFTAIQNLTNAAMGFGKKVVGMLTGPIWQGGLTRSLNMEQARFQFKGLGMDVEASMKSSLDAVKGTAYGLDEAAVVAAQFGASGMKAGDDMTAALRGIAGVAAMAGSSYSDIGNVFTKVAGQGRLMGDDLNRLATRGVNAAATIAESMGKTEEEVRAMVTKGKISFQDFADAMSNAFGEHATKANETYKGSLSNLRAAFARIGADIHTPKLEAMRKVFNALTPAVDNVHNALKPFLRTMAGSMEAASANVVKFLGNFNKEGQEFRKLSTIMTLGFGSIRRISESLFMIIKPLGTAFRQIFPGPTLRDIQKAGIFMYKLSEALRPSESTVKKLTSVFSGFFAILGIGWEIIKQLAVSLFTIFGAITKGSGSILDVAAKIGDFFTNLHKEVKNGDAIATVFGKITDAGVKLVEKIREIASGIFEFVSGLDLLSKFKMPNISQGFSDIYNSVSPLSAIGTVIKNLWSGIISLFKNIGKALGPVGVLFGKIFGEIGTHLLNALKNLDLQSVLSVLNTGLFAMLVNTIRGYIGGLGEAAEEGDGIIDKIKGAFGGLTDTFDEMQNTLKAATLIQIAIAIGIITASVVALSGIDSAALAKALTAITVMFTQLFASMAIFQKITDPKAFAGMVTVTTAMILLAIALRILASAVKTLSELSWEELAKGLLAVTVLLAALAGSSKLMSGNAAGMIRTGAALLILAVAIKVLASAVKDLSGLSWEEMAKGLVGVGGLLAALVLFTKFVSANKGGVLQSAGLLLLAAAIKVLASAATDFAQLSWEEMAKGLTAIGALLVGLAGFTKVVGGEKKMVSIGLAMVLLGGSMKILASAMKDFAGMSWEEIARGLVAMGGALVILAAAMFAMQKGIGGAVAMMIVAPALVVLANALKTMSGMQWDEIGRGLVVLAGSLAIIALGLFAMQKGIGGAAALIVVAAALKILAPILQTFAGMSIKEVATALGMLAGVFIILGVAGLALTPLVPTLLGLGAAVALLGVGMLAAGAGLMLFSAGLTALSVSGVAGATALVAIFAALLGLIPLLLQAIAELVKGILQIIIEVAPMIGEAFVALMNMFLNAIIELAPTIFEAIKVLLLGLIDVIVEVTQPIVDALVGIIVAIIEGVKAISPILVDAIVSILKDVLYGLEALVPEVVDLFVFMLESIVDAIVDSASYIVDGFEQILTDILAAAERNVPLIVRTLLNMIETILNDLSDSVPRMVTAGMEMIIGVAKGIGDNIDRVVTEATNIIVNFIDSIADNQQRIIESGVNLIISFIEGVTRSIRDNTDRMNTAGADLAKAIIQGMTSGLTNGVSSIRDAAIGVARSALSAAKGFLGIRSPSKEFEKVGNFVNDGFAKGLRGNSDQVAQAFDNLKSMLESTMQSAQTNADKARDRLQKLTSARKKDNAAIAKARQELAQANKELSASKAAYTELTKAQTANQKKLGDLATKREGIIESLKEETKALEDAIKTRDDYNKSVLNQYNKLGDISGEDKTLDSYMDEMSKKIIDTKTFSETIQDLRKLGLNDELYKELVSKGAGALPFAQNLLAAGKDGVRAANDMGEQLTRVSKKLADNASTALYQAAVDSAKGLVKGLESQEAAITKQMEKLADSMVAAVKKKLGIKSPSKEFEKLGKFSNEGMAKGLKRYSDVVSDAAENVGTDALKTLRKSISGLSGVINDEMDLSPTISPVLDLSDISKGVRALDSMVGGASVRADASYSKAQVALAAQRAHTQEMLEAKTQSRGDMVFNQYNNSPKALDRSEIYRQTKNQLSVARGALDT